MNYLSACLIVKDEAQYLQEWIEFHKLVSFEHFYIYDNNSSDGSTSILDPYIRSEEITYNFWPEKFNQLGAYDHCLSIGKSDNQWIAFIDIDEFLFPLINEDIKVSLQDYESQAILGINWTCFGSSGHLGRPDGLVIENYNHRAPFEYSRNQVFKSIVNMNWNHKPGKNPHRFVEQSGMPTVDEDFEIIDGEKSYLTEHVLNKKFRLNRYIIKSEEDFVFKLERGRADGPKPKPNYWGSIDPYCVIEDTLIHKYVPKVKLAIKPNALQLTINHKRKERMFRKGKKLRAESLYYFN